MTVAIADTDVTPIDLQKIQSGDPFDFQKLYRRFYDILLDETTVLPGHQQQATALVQLSCIQSWSRCEDINSEQYYFGYARSRVLRYAQVWSRQEPRINHERRILQEILSDKYALSGQHMASLYGHLTLSQRELVRQVFRSYFRDHSAHSLTDKQPALLRYAFYTLHYILA